MKNLPVPDFRLRPFSKLVIPPEAIAIAQCKEMIQECQPIAWVPLDTGLFGMGHRDSEVLRLVYSGGLSAECAEKQDSFFREFIIAVIPVFLFVGISFRWLFHSVSRF